MDYTFDVVGVGVTAAEGVGDSTEPEVGGHVAHVGCDDDVVALAHSDAELFGGVRDNWDEIVCDDLEGVVIDHEVEVGVDCAIDQTS